MFSAQFEGAIKPNSGTNFSFELRTPSRRGAFDILRKAHLSPKLWTPRIRYGTRNSNLSKSLQTVTKIGSATPLGRARASDPIRHVTGRNLPHSQSLFQRSFLRRSHNPTILGVLDLSQQIPKETSAACRKHSARKQKIT